TFAIVRPACASTVSRLSNAWLSWAAMSPGWSTRPSGSTDVWPAQKKMRSAPRVSTPCEKLKASCQVHGFTAFMSITRSFGRILWLASAQESADAADDSAALIGGSSVERRDGLVDGADLVAGSPPPFLNLSWSSS